MARSSESAVPTPTPHLRLIGPRDSFAGSVGDEYDPDAIYVRSVDTHGHSTSTRVNFHPDTAAEISRIIASGALAGTPLDSLSACVRDAMVHWLHKMAVKINDPVLMQAAQMERHIAILDSIAREQGSKTAVVANARSYLDNAMSAGDALTVERLVDAYDKLADGYDEPYAGQIKQCLTSARSWLKMHSS